MSSWLDVDTGAGSVRRRLQPGLTLVGGDQGELAIPGTGTDRLHVWDQPPKLMFVGSGEPPRINGTTREEAALDSGDAIEWAGARLVFGTEVATLEELPAPASPPVPPPVQKEARAGALAGSAQVVWRRLHAGMVVELGLADKATARRWQDAVVRGEYEADACARDVLGSCAVAPDDPRVTERSARLQRDLLMAPLQRGVQGASRRARNATKSGIAWFLSQLITLAIFALLGLIALFVLRARWEWSVDAFLDRIRGVFGGGG